MTTFTIACNDRRKDQTTGQWIDGDTTFPHPAKSGANAARSWSSRSAKANGHGHRQTPPTPYEAKDGTKRTVYEPGLIATCTWRRNANHDPRKTSQEPFAPSAEAARSDALARRSTVRPTDTVNAANAPSPTTRHPSTTADPEARAGSIRTASTGPRTVCSSVVAAPPMPGWVEHNRAVATDQGWFCATPRPARPRRRPGLHRRRLVPRHTRSDRTRRRRLRRPVLIGAPCPALSAPATTRTTTANATSVAATARQTRACSAGQARNASATI